MLLIYRCNKFNQDAGRKESRRRRQPELDPVNQGELVMVVDL